MTGESISPDVQAAADRARAELDAHVFETVQWHFHPSTGCPFWLEKAKELKVDPLKEVLTFDDLKKFPEFQDEWLRGGPVRRWVPKPLADKPIYVFETGGTTGIPKSRIAMDDFRTDYSLFSDTLPEKYFPFGANWMMLGPSGPRRLRLAVEHLAQHRGGICFCVDLDPRWVIKLIKMGEIRQAELYKQHVIEQGLTLLKAHEIQCMFTTPKLLEALCEKTSLKKMGIKGIFCGGTEMTPQFHRFAREELLDGIFFAPTYGNTLMGLATHKPRTRPDEPWDIIYYPPSPRAVIEVVHPDQPDRVVDYGQTGRV